MRGTMPRARHSRRRRPGGSGGGRRPRRRGACPGDAAAGRACPPERTGGTASSAGASIRLSCRFAPPSARPSGVPPAGVRDHVPPRARLAAIRRVRADERAPPCAGTEALSSAARRRSICPAPPRPVEPLRQHAVQGRPDPGRPPVAQPAPAAHPRAAPHLGRQVLPRDAGLEDEDDAGRRRAVRDRRSAAFRLRPRGRQQRRDHRPEVVGNEGASHARRNAPDRVSLGALSSTLAIQAAWQSAHAMASRSAGGSSVSSGACREMSKPCSAQT